MLSTMRVIDAITRMSLLVTPLTSCKSNTTSSADNGFIDIAHNMYCESLRL